MAEEEFEIPVPESFEEKETYAFAGLAFYWAQVLEHGALNLAVVLSLPEIGAVTQELFEELFENLSRKTLGQLIKAAKTELTVNAETESMIADALETRNKLIHRFFRDHAEDFISEAGRKIMIEELSAMVLRFKEADAAIEALCIPLWEKYGVDETFINREMKAMVARARDRD